jgi:CarD family transcriptional regulator
MHGAGIIDSIENKKIMGTSKKYYVLLVPFGDMKVMIPCESCDQIGIRGIMSRDEMEYVFDTLKEASTEMSSNWNRRYRDNMEKLKTGDLTSVAEVVRNLMRVDCIKKLSMGEKKMLSNAKQILVSEVVLVQELDVDEALVIIEKHVLG